MRVSFLIVIDRITLILFIFFGVSLMNNGVFGNKIIDSIVLPVERLSIILAQGILLPVIIAFAT
jgi:hypothetical protein